MSDVIALVCAGIVSVGVLTWAVLYVDYCRRFDRTLAEVKRRNEEWTAMMDAWWADHREDDDHD